MKTLTFSESSFGILTRFVDGFPKMLCDNVLHLIVVHEFLKEFLVLLSSINEQLSKHTIEFKGEVVLRIDLRRLSQSVIL